MIVTVLVAGIAVSATIVYFSFPQNAASPAATIPVTNATWSINLSQPLTPLSPDLLGVNVRADSSINGTQGATVAATSVRFVRWPGGGLADRYDPFGPNGTATIYSDSGSFETAASTPADFADWCRSIQCSSIVTVPGETNQSSLAAQEVQYFESDLDFHPTYWEIGNEPGTWDHFGIPWSAWQPNQTAPPSPTEYAELVHRYISAMRSVDPTLRFIGLPGIGGSNASETTWIKETVAVNGPNLSAVALHIYPAGPIQNKTTLSEFLSSLTGLNGLASRLTTARAAVADSCASCSIAVLADEVAAATGPGSPNYLTGFPLVPYEASEVIQGIVLNVSAMVFWVADSGYSGSWVTPDGSARPIYTLFTTFLDQLPPDRANSTLTSEGTGLNAVVLTGRSGVPGPIVLLATNANSSDAFRLTVSDAFSSSGSVSGWSWNGSSSAPEKISFRGPSLPTFYLAPLSVLRIEINGSFEPLTGAEPLSGSPSSLVDRGLLLSPGPMLWGTPSVFQLCRSADHAQELKPSRVSKW